MQHYAQLLIVDDNLKMARLRHFLVVRGPNNNHQEDQPGLVGLVLQSRQARNAWRRVAVLRLLDQVVKGTSSELVSSRCICTHLAASWILLSMRTIFDEDGQRSKDVKAVHGAELVSLCCFCTLLAGP